MKNKILEYTQKFFNKLLIEVETLDILEENNLFYHIKIKSIDWIILIWQNWQTIESLQRILWMSIANIFNKEIKIKLQINDYHKSYEDKLLSRIDRSVNSLLNNWWEYELWILSTFDRKKIHKYIARNYKNITSKSKWEWYNRKISLQINERKNKLENISTPLKLSKLTIDIDWNWI